MAGILVALAGVLIAAVGLTWNFLRERRRRRADEEEKRRRVAERVAVWVESGRGPEGDYLVVVGNTGDQPVYQCVAYVSTGSSEHPHLAEVVFATVPPRAEQRAWVGVAHVGRVGPFPHLPAVSVRFTDPAGRHWLRDAKGQLHKQEHAALMC